MISSSITDKALPTHLTTVDEFERWQQEPGNDGSFEEASTVFKGEQVITAVPLSPIFNLL